MKWIPIQNSCSNAERLSSVPEVLTTIPGGGLTEVLEDIINRTRDGDLLRIISPVVDDEGILELLLDARDRGVSIRLLTTLSDRHGIKTKGWDASQDIEKHDECVRVLAKAGVSLRSPITTPHGKIIVRNHESAFFGSANLTQGSLRGHALEAAIQFVEPAIVGPLVRYFDIIWKASRFRMRHKAGTVILEEGPVEPLHISTEETNCRSDNCGVFLIAPGVAHGTMRLEHLIRHAKSDIYLVALSLYDTQKIPGLHSALLEALDRNVQVRAIVRQEHFRREEEKGHYPDPSTIELLERGMEIYGCPGLHAKALLVDGDFVTIQSANINPYSLASTIPECNFELMVSGTTANTGLRGYAKWIQMLPSQSTHRM